MFVGLTGCNASNLTVRSRTLGNRVGWSEGCCLAKKIVEHVGYPEIQRLIMVDHSWWVHTAIFRHTQNLIGSATSHVKTQEHRNIAAAFSVNPAVPSFLHPQMSPISHVSREDFGLRQLLKPRRLWSASRVMRKSTWAITSITRASTWMWPMCYIKSASGALIELWTRQRNQDKVW